MDKPTTPTIKADLLCTTLTVEKETGLTHGVVLTTSTGFKGLERGKRYAVEFVEVVEAPVTAPEGKAPATFTPPETPASDEHAPETK